MDLDKYKKIISSISTAHDGNLNTSNSVSSSLIVNNETITFTIINKNINTPVSMKDILVQGDKNSRKIHFVMQRYFDGVDLSSKHIFINFINAENRSGADDISNFEADNEILTFDWFVPGELTVLQGEVSIQVEVSDFSETDDVIYRYLTKPLGITIERTVIVNDDAEPIDYYLDIRFLNKYTEDITCDMASAIPPIEINNRTIVMPSLDNIIVTNDAKSKIITFIMDRYIDCVDLSEKTACIKFKLANGAGDRAFVYNRVISDTQIRFDWLFDSRVSICAGKIEFAIEFIGYDEKGEFYCWGTLPSYLFVSQGLDVDTIIEQPTASWIQSWNIQADKYLRDYMKYVTEIRENVEAASKYASDAMSQAINAKASAVSSENNANIAWTQADRASQAKTLTEQYKNKIIIDKADFDKKYSDFLLNYANIRKKNDPIGVNDLDAILAGIINSKSDKGHTHDVSDISYARSTQSPIRESDLDAALVKKLNSSGSGGGGIVASEIDDMALSFSKTWSSQKVRNAIDIATGGLVSSDGNKGLSANDFSDYYRKKLDSVDENANYFDAQMLIGLSLGIFAEDSAHKLVTDSQMKIWDDKYTRNEVDNIIAGIATGLQWQPSVTSYDDIIHVYPKPEKNWAVSTSNGDGYVYNGTDWVKFSSGITPLVTTLLAGLMSPDDKKKLDGIDDNANNYILPQLYASDIRDDATKVLMTTQERNKLAAIETYIDSILTNYRKNGTKIKESDIDTAFLDKLANAGGALVNDNLISSSHTYSSQQIENLFQDMQQEIEQNCLTTTVIDSWF